MKPKERIKERIFESATLVKMVAPVKSEFQVNKLHRLP